MWSMFGNHWTRLFPTSWLPIHMVIYYSLSFIVWILQKDEEAKLQVVQASRVVPCSHTLVTGSFTYLAGKAAAVQSFPWLKTRSRGSRHAGNTCWVPCLCFSPCFHLSTPPLPPLSWICHCLFFHLHLLSPPLIPPPLLLHLASLLCISIPASLHPCSAQSQAWQQ